MLAIVSDWGEYLQQPSSEMIAAEFHRHTGTGRPLGDDGFIDKLEQRLNRSLRPQKRGPKPRPSPGEKTDLFSLPEDDSN